MGRRPPSKASRQAGSLQCPPCRLPRRRRRRRPARARRNLLQRNPPPRSADAGAHGMSKLTGSQKATQFTESVIREMTRLNQLYGGVNLSQGFPDFPAPQAIKDAACAAVQGEVNQYAVTWGARTLREAIAREFMRRYGVAVVPDEQVTVC